MGRTMMAGAVAPAEASWVALMVLYTACVRYGAPEHLISDSGGAFISKEFEAVCKRLQIDHQHLESTKGESYLNLMETHFNIHWRLFDNVVLAEYRCRYDWRTYKVTDIREGVVYPTRFPHPKAL